MKCNSFFIFLFVLSTSSLILAKEDGKRRQGLAYFPSNASTRLKSKNIVGFPDTLRIVAIRVEFIEDGSELTTGNGRFDLSGFPSPNSDDLIFDPPPHNKLYFEDHLTALKNYYFSVSKGNLVLQSMVYPDASVESYQLPQQMDYYNPNTTDEILDQRLAELMRDAFTTADNQDNIDFSQFDVFMVFHAGVGKDIAFDLDPTPKDIPSVFLNLSDFRKNLGNGDPSFQGIPVNNNTFFIPEGIILPETENQEGIQFGLNGTIALMVGFQLGLPNLFNTDTGEAGIGAFGLMDQGSGNFFGLLPAQPCAWSKVYMGWETPVILREGISIEVVTALVKNGQRIIKVPISAKEYFFD